MVGPILGIDFGASKIVAAVYSKDKDIAEIITDSQNVRSMPCCVAFTDKGRLFMHTALYQAENNPENTIFGRGKCCLYGLAFSYF